MRKVAIVSLLVLVIALCAMAAYSMPSYQVVQNSGVYNIDGGDMLSWDVAGFDSSLGKLLSASVDLYTTVDGTWSVTNTGRRPVSTNGEVAGATYAYFYADPSITGVSAAYASDNWDTTLPAKDSSIGGQISGSDEQHYYFGNWANLDSLKNPWQVTFENWSGFYSENIPATAKADNFVTGTAQAVVTYNYQPVPEPSSLLVLVAGGAGMFGFIKRRRA